MNKGWKTYNDTMPEYLADLDYFKVTFNVAKEPVQTSGDLKSGQTGGQTGDQTGNFIKPTKRQKDVLILIEKNVFISRKELSHMLKINESAVQKHIDALKQKGLIERIGGDFGG